MDNEIYTLNEAAAYLKVCYRTIFRMVKANSLPAFKIGRQWRIRKSDLDTFINNGRNPGFLGQRPIFFRLAVLNRYKDNPKFYIRDEEFGGVFGMKPEFIHQGKDYDFVFEYIAEVHYKKVAMAGGTLAVCLDDPDYAATVCRVPDEYNHWHSYRIHSPSLGSQSS